MQRHFPDDLKPMFEKIMAEARIWADTDDPILGETRVQAAFALVGIAITIGEAHGLLRVYWETEGGMMDIPDDLDDILDLYEDLCEKHMRGGTCFLQL
ncbi:hypothetical protein [Pseudodesulfovibrio pelocollis]|uniref:hypothetical protein n=1 Tax=Pseudodesulfovibrio pelocollis TaxID=3051432 RepID=UPI00255AE69C|nr:hypothetical protein [Pseudodesulfovibrio sp. SB368]